MAGLVEGLAAGLAALGREGLVRTRRVAEAREGATLGSESGRLVDFSSNDYLGLSTHPALAAAAHAAIDQVGTGAGASPLVSGHFRAHEEAEARFATFVGLPRALLFGSGYAANLGMLEALGGREAAIFGDRLNHACLVDGAILSRAAFTRLPHGDVGALASALERSAARVKIVATDAVFSMDGDVAPLRETLALCERHDAWLVIDDAHGIGVLGREGRGTLDHLGLASERIVYMATLGKALGGYGAFVAGHATVVEWLLQKARTYVFSTALPPACAAVATAAIGVLESPESPLRRLRGNIEHLAKRAREAGLALRPSPTAIHPLVVGEPQAAVDASQALERAGLRVPAIRPPTVPRGTSRLRLSISAAHAEADIDRLVRELAALRAVA